MPDAGCFAFEVILCERPMSDVFTKEKRSEVMSRIRGGGNQDTELALMRLLRREGIAGWRRQSALFGRPDFVFTQLRLAVFVDGCFWHGCPKHANLPVNNRRFWKRKFESNQRRDKLVRRTLRAKGWHVLRIWEHELTGKNEKRLIRRLARALTTSAPNSGQTPPSSF
jgi:DNA mismatch endonuclease (patch repair protein)